MNRREFMKMVAAITGAQFVPKIDVEQPEVQPAQPEIVDIPEGQLFLAPEDEYDDYILFSDNLQKMKWYPWVNRIAVYEPNLGNGAFDDFPFERQRVNLHIACGGAEINVPNCTLRKHSIEVYPTGHMMNGTPVSESRTVFEYIAEGETE